VAHVVPRPDTSTARGLAGVSLVTSDAHLGLVAASATISGASWQRCRTQLCGKPEAGYAKSSWGW
jgi:hypothetical protein